MFYATDVCCYGRVYNDVSQLDPNDTLVQRRLYAHVRKYKSWIFPKYYIGLCILYFILIINWLLDIWPFKLRKLLRAYTVKKKNSRLGLLRSGHAVLCPFFQLRYSTVLDEKSNDLLPFLFRCAALNYYCTTVTEMGICSQLHCIWV